MNQNAIAARNTRLRDLTPARVGLAITGISQQTGDLLSFQSAHARARDAVHAKLDAYTLTAEIKAVTGNPVLTLRSKAADRATYLQRPDLGRELSEESRRLLAASSGNHCDLAIVVADGLSALAVHRHVVPLLQILVPTLASYALAPVCIVEQGRVAIGDAIGEALDASLAIVLIGERPGLSSPDSLGAYITWNPRIGRKDAERNCISNIRGEGLTYAEAAKQLAFYINEASRRKITGIALKEDANRLGEG